MGQLITKEVGGVKANTLQQAHYGYNIRGWMTSINNPDALGDDLFGFNLFYNESGEDSSCDLFNGNISKSTWSTANFRLKLALIILENKK